MSPEEDIQRTLGRLEGRLDEIYKECAEATSIVRTVGEHDALLKMILETQGRMSVEMRKLRREVGRAVGIVNLGERRTTDLKSIAQLIAVTLIPVILALIGGYFTLKAAGVSAGGGSTK